MSLDYTVEIVTDKSSLKVYDLEKNQQLIDRCVDEVADKLIQNPKITVYGKPAYQHRNIGFFSDTSIGYYYSRQLAKSQPLTPYLSELLNLINTTFSCHFNGILINKYKDGNDYIGKHSDDETHLDKIGVVAISIGAVRKFRIRDRVTGKIVKDIATTPYSLIQMDGDFQKEFTHEIPIERKIKQHRYSITFRRHNI